MFQNVIEGQLYLSNMQDIFNIHETLRYMYLVTIRNSKTHLHRDYVEGAVNCTISNVPFRFK